MTETLMQHVKHASFQAGYVWGQAGYHFGLHSPKPPKAPRMATVRNIVDNANAQSTLKMYSCLWQSVYLQCWMQSCELHVYIHLCIDSCKHVPPHFLDLTTNMQWSHTFSPEVNIFDILLHICPTAINAASSNRPTSWMYLWQPY